MNTLLTFITVLAWISGCFATLVVAAKLFMICTYSELQRMLDFAKYGAVRNYAHNFLIWLTITFISWAWIIARAATK